MRTVLLLVSIAACGLAQTTVFTWSGASPSDFAGASLAGPGDLDGDGVPDVVIGATTPITSSANDGSVTARSGVDGSVLWQVLGQPNERLGLALATAGDVTGDGVNDLVVAAPGARGVLLLSGAGGGFIRSMTDPCLDVDGGHDFDGDSVPDQLGVYKSPLLGPAGVKVYSGVDGSVLLSIDSSAPVVFPGFGSPEFRGAFLKDVDGDGFDDVVAGRMLSGMVVRFRGPAGALGGVVSLPGATLIAVHDVGSVSHDDLHDAAVSWQVPGTFPSGQSTRAYKSSTGGIMWEVTANFWNPGLALFLVEVARLPDLDGDGKPELATPSYVSGGMTNPATATGVTVLSGAAGSVLFSVFTPVPQAGVLSIANVGDLTGDGIPELAFGYSEYPSGPGHVTVLSPVTLTAASVVDLGGACGAFSTILSASAPTLGSTLTFGLVSGQPLASANLFVDLAPHAATPLDCGIVHLDLANVLAWTAVPWTLDASGSATFAYGVPVVPALEGQPFSAQAIVLGTVAPAGFDLSNGLAGVLGY